MGNSVRTQVGVLQGRQIYIRFDLTPNGPTYQHRLNPAFYFPTIQNMMRASLLFLLLAAVVIGCDHGLVPPASSGTGRIEGVVEYVGEWPALEDLHDLRFVGMRFVPKDTSDFLQLNQMAISPGLQTLVDSDAFVIEDVAAGLYLYSGVAQQFEADLLSWRPVGLYKEDGGIFSVAPNETTYLSILVDFNNLPIFPPTP